MSDEERSGNQRSRNEQLPKAEIVDELKDYFDSKFNELKRSVKTDTEWIAESARKKVRKDSSVSLKGLSNKKQYQFNCDIDDLLDSTVSLRNVNRAHDYITEAKDLIKHRNKLIRIADSSPSGWSTIHEYEILDVASDSEDDKRIRRAEDRAKARIDKAKPSSTASYYNPGFQSNFRSFRRGTGARFPVAGGSAYQHQPAPVVCFRCGQLGHIASGCVQVNTGFPSRQLGPSTATSAATESEKPVAAKNPRLFTSERWLNVQDMCNLLPRGQGLFSEVKNAVMSSKEDSTLRNYKYSFEKFSKWCSRFSFSNLPASPVTVAIYLVSLIQLEDELCGKSKLNLAFYSVSCMHELACLDNPCKDSWLKLCLEGCIRKVARPVNKKEPISPDILKELIHKFASENCALGDLRIVILCVLSYAGFLRISEALNLKRSDIEFFDSYCSLYIEKSKTDVYRDGQHVVIAKTGKFSCPVALLERYLQAAKISSDSTEHIFRPVTSSTRLGVCELRKPLNKQLSYTRTREIFKKMLTEIGLDSSKYGLHSFRSGAATASANLKTCDRLWKRHGRWKSVTAKDGYVKDSIKDRLSVSLNLDL